MSNQATLDLITVETWDGAYEPSNEVDLSFEIVHRYGERIDVTLLAVRDGADGVDLLDRITSAQRDRLEEELLDLLDREDEHGPCDRWNGWEP